jgi:hypothetical protein
MVKRQLLVGEALRRGLVPAEEQALMLEQAKQQLALRTLVEQEAPSDVPVSDAEVQSLYDRRAHETHALIVFTRDERAVQQALTQIQAGADFGATADRFNTTGMTPRGGDLGFVVAGGLPQGLDDALADAPIGKVTGPVQSPPDGWFLLKVLERRPRQQPPFEAMKEELRLGLRQSKQRAAVGRLQQKLLEQYHVRTEPGAAQALFQRYNAPSDTTMVGNVPMPVPAAPTAEEAKRALVRYDDASGKPAAYTLGDAVRDLQDPSRTRPDWSVLPSIEQWLPSMVVERIALIEVARRHLMEEPALERQAQGRADNALLRAAYTALVLQQAAPPTEADVRAAYDRHVVELVGPDGKPVEFAKVNAQVRQALEAEAAEMNRERKLNEVVEALRQQVKPEVHLERLKKITWPLPAATPGK